jgi:hypothetical protein
MRPVERVREASRLWSSRRQRCWPGSGKCRSSCGGFLWIIEELVHVSAGQAEYAGDGDSRYLNPTQQYR